MRTYSHESPSVLDVRDPYSEFYQGPHHGKHWYLWHPDDIGTAKPMNELAWFKAFQPLLLKVVNTGYGRQLMGIDQDLPNIIQIYKNALHCDLGDGRKLYEVRVGAKWANVIRYRWPEFKRYARYFYDMPNFFTLIRHSSGILVPAHATSTFYPDADTESTTVDGKVRRTESRVSFATTRNGAGNNSRDTHANETIGYLNYRDDDYFSDDTEGMTRNPCLFDVSSIDSGTALDSANISLVCTWGGSTAYVTVAQGDVLLDFTACDPASNTALVDADYNIANWTDTSLARGTQDLDQETVDDSTYTDYAFNGTGMEFLSDALGGILKIGGRLDRDTDSIAPLPNTIANHGQNGGNSGAGLSAYCADETGTGKDPKLSVIDCVETFVQKAIFF